MSERDRWIEHIKQVRAEHGISILAAERLALADDHWRRWVERQINNDDRCRRMALRHIHYNGDEALICQSRNRFNVR